jgi:hypothetical protein
MPGPSASQWSILHVVVFVGIHREIYVRALVFENVLQTTPCCAILSVFGPHKGFRCFHVPEYSAVLDPIASDGTPFSGTVMMRAAGLIEMSCKVGMICHGW